MSRIERIARAASARRSAAAKSPGTGGEAGSVNLPVPVGEARDVPRSEPRPDAVGGDAVFEAQLMGQEGQKRGLRGGQSVLDAARRTYNRIEWSGAWDRRARKGRKAREEI